MIGNPIDDKGAEAIAEALKVNGVLQILGLGGISASKAAEALVDALDVNGALQTLNFLGQVFQVHQMYDDIEGRKKRAEEHKGLQLQKQSQMKTKELQRQLEEKELKHKAAEEKLKQEQARVRLELQRLELLKQEVESKKEEEDKRIQLEKQKQEEEIGKWPKETYLTNVKKGKRLGEGHFGEVFMGEWLGDSVALKTFKTDKLEEIEKEIKTFQ